jgi:hypothetical protein
MRSPLWLVICLGLVAPGVAAEKPARPNEIVVSAANYAETPPKELAKLFRRPADLADPAPPPDEARPAKHYQFLPGEVFDSDLNYREVCQLLLPALARRNFHNTFEEAKVDYVLRVSFGGRRWRDPLVRLDHLEWTQGVVPQRKSTALGAAGTWDARAGGDESALYDTERTLAEVHSGAEGMADRLIGGMPTEDYFLIVVDAFEVAELRTKGNKAARAWTTFIAVPQQSGRKFSAVAAGMIEKATPYFGATLPGKARFTDRSGKVTIGEAVVVEEDAAPRPKR